MSSQVHPPRRFLTLPHLTPRKVTSGAIWYLVVIFLAVLVIFPFIWMISTSVKPLDEVFVYPPRWIPQNLTWENYVEVWKKAPFAQYFVNSTIVALCVTIGQLVSCSLAAFAFARMKFAGKSFMFMVFMSTTFISTQVTLVPSYLLINKLGWMDSYPALIVPFIANAFGVFMIRQAFMAVPRELEEAAKLDGCGRMRFLLQIMLPLNKPIMASQALFAFMGNWNSYLWPLIVTNEDEMRTLQIGLRYFIGSEGGTEWGIYMAAAVLVTFPIVIFYFFVQKTFVESMASSGLKDV